MKPKYYDRTQNQRQAKRRALFRRMREALQSIERTTLDAAAREMAVRGLSEEFSENDEKGVDG